MNGGGAIQDPRSRVGLMNNPGMGSLIFTNVSKTAQHLPHGFC